MKRILWVIATILIILLVGWKYMTAIRTVEYQGQTFKVSKPYISYDSYREDSNRLPASELPRIQKAMMQAKTKSSYSSWDQLVHDVPGIRFPGYGYGRYGDKPVTQGGVLIGFDFVIPGLGKNRCFTFRRSGPTYTWIDDCLISNEKGITRVEEHSGRLVFFSVDEVLAGHKPQVPK